MISAMPAVAVRRERKKQQRAAANRANSLSSLGTNSTRSTNLSSSSAPSTPLGLNHPYYNYYSSRTASRAPSPATVSLSLPQGQQGGGGGAGGGPKKSSSNPSVSTITSAATTYVSALHRVRERQLDAQRERARFILYTGSVLIASGLALIFIGLAISVSSAQTIGLLFVGSGSIFCLARYFCFDPGQIPLVKKARTVSGQSIYNCGQSLPSTATTPGTDDSSTASSYYFSAVPLHRVPLSPSQDALAAVTPTSSTAGAVAPATTVTSPSSQPPIAPVPPLPPPTLVHGGSLHRDRHSIRSNASSILTPMSLNSIPEMQVLITDDSQGY